MYLLDSLFGFDGRVVVVRKVNSNQILWHESLLKGFSVEFPCFHYMFNPPDRNSTKRPRNFPAGALQFPPAPRRARQRPGLLLFQPTIQPTNRVVLYELRSVWQ